MPGRDSRFTCRLYGVEDDLRYGALLAGETRSEFVRRAVRERTRRLEREMDEDATNGEERTDA